jgi:hypothetical protein
MLDKSHQLFKYYFTHLLILLSCNNTINTLKRLLVYTFYSAHHQTMHHLELKKNHTIVLI